MRILIVDDSRAMQTIVRRGLEKAGYEGLETKLASDGHEALDIIRVWEPNLVLSDWHMPGMTGMELLTELNRQMLSINVGFVTTETSSARINQAMSAGAKFFVHKPFDVETLHKAILPFVPSSNSAPEESENGTKGGRGILLPNASTLSKVVSGLCEREMFVEAMDPVGLNHQRFPYLLGLFSDDQEQVVRAVCILDVCSASVIAGAMLDMPENQVHKTINESSLSKELVSACKRFFRVTSATMRNQSTGQDLHMLSANLVTQSFPKLEMLFQKPAAQRADFEVAVSGYGQGSVTIVAS